MLQESKLKITVGVRTFSYYLKLSTTKAQLANTQPSIKSLVKTHYVPLDFARLSWPGQMCIRWNI